MSHFVSINFHDEILELHPEHIIWWPATRRLILSDVHLGKSATFRYHGVPVPEGETDEDLGRIEKLIARFKPEALIIVGDLIHSSTSLPPDFMADLNRWFESLPCPSLLVRGNHDPSARKLDDLPALEHCEHYQLGIFHFVHDPEDAPPDIPTVTGHLHPLCRVGTKRGPQIRVPCFLHHNNCLTLPAFGTFTSGNMTRPETGKCYPVVQGKVFPAF